NQVVIGYVSVLQEDLFVERIDCGHMCEKNPGVTLPAQRRPDGVSNVTGVQCSGGHLVQKGLKQVVIATINEGELHWGAFQSTGRIETTEPTSNDHDMGDVPVIGVIGHCVSPLLFSTRACLSRDSRAGQMKYIEPC